MEKSSSMNRNENKQPLPMSVWQSVGIFGVPSLLFAVSVHILLPALDRAGVPLFLNFLISLGGPLGVLLIASFVAYRREELPWSWSAFRDRFRLGAMKMSTWLWVVGLSVFMFLSRDSLSFSADWLQQVVAPMPAALARMQEIKPNEFMGIPLAGAWWVLLGYLFYAVMNVMGEELWWRGYVLPRQELSFGKRTWVVHGFFWTMFHSFFYWELIMNLPGCLALAYVATKWKSTWPGIIAHFAYSLPSLVIILIGIMS